MAEDPGVLRRAWSLLVIGVGLRVYALVQVAYESEWRMKGLDRTHIPITKTNLLPVAPNTIPIISRSSSGQQRGEGGWWAKKGTRRG